MEIKQVQTKKEIENIRVLFREYEKFLGVDLCFQGFEKELADLPGQYSPPYGQLFIALDNGIPAGCVAVRKIASDICEMKRLFVRPEARGKGLGRKLAQKTIVTAINFGYSCMRLDTLESLSDAVNLYTKLGFKKTLPYCINPLEGAIFMELDLKGDSFLDRD